MFEETVAEIDVSETLELFELVARVDELEKGGQQGAGFRGCS